VAIHYIPEELVLTVHADLLQRYGGQPGLRDRGLLESALAQPRMTADGKEVHKTLFEKAAAYGFHVCNNHPFIDGNKRVAFVLMDIFLQKNGWAITATEEEAYSTIMSLASSKLSKTEPASRLLKEHSARLTRR
jgi:death-on-curing protein